MINSSNGNSTSKLLSRKRRFLFPAIAPWFFDLRCQFHQHFTRDFLIVLHHFSPVGIVIFWHKNFDEKAACKILMKLTTGRQYGYRFRVWRRPLLGTSHSLGTWIPWRKYDFQTLRFLLRFLTGGPWRGFWGPPRS
jgi:hypothetical protein